MRPAESEAAEPAGSPRGLAAELADSRQVGSGHEGTGSPSNHEGTGSPFVETVAAGGAGSAPAAWLSRSRNAPSSAIVLISGAGNTTVEFLSTATSTSVCRF